MPRAARRKDPSAIYHTMSRSITEFDMFPDSSDKEHFLDLLLKYKEKYQCKIYTYCLMNNHYHILIDTCGFDISKFMKCLNQAYVKYINHKYKRRGHLLAERFNSKIIDSVEYLLTASAYIHNNCKDIPEYINKEFEYPYSSMSIYLGRLKDKRNLVDTDCILGSINEVDKTKAMNAYLAMVIERREIGINVKLRKYLDEFQSEQYEYKSYREVVLRDKKPEEIIKFIAKRFGISDIRELMHKWKRSTMKFREFIAYTLTVLCGMGYKEVCKCMHNITVSTCARLSQKGFESTRNNWKLKKLMLELCRI